MGAAVIPQSYPVAVGEPVVSERWSFGSTFGLVQARRRAVAVARPFLDPDRLDDLALVVSELATNALEHGDGDVVRVEVTASADAVVVTVENDGDQLPVIEVDLVPPDRGHGRGLRIVTALVDGLNVRASRRRIVVECRFELASLAS